MWVVLLSVPLGRRCLHTSVLDRMGHKENQSNEVTDRNVLSLSHTIQKFKAEHHLKKKKMNSLLKA